MPQSTRRRGRACSRIPARAADSSPGAFATDSGGISSQSAPYASTPMNWNVISATKAIRIGSTGQPRWRARPVLTPPSQAPSATRVARGRSRGEDGSPVSGLGEDGAPASGLGEDGSPVSGPGGASIAGAATTGSPGDETCLESVAVIMYVASHAGSSTPSGDDPDSTLKSARHQRVVWGWSLMDRG